MHSSFATSVVPMPPWSIATVTCSDGDGDLGTISAIASSIAEPACAKAKNNRVTTMEAIFTLGAMVWFYGELGGGGIEVVWERSVQGSNVGMSCDFTILGWDSNI
jgi:hypothetical protein